MSKKHAELTVTAAALLFAALGDPTRLALLRRLSEGGPASIATLSGSLPVMTRQGLSKHLHVLAAAGAIDSSRRGREHVWAINAIRLAEARRHLKLVARGWDDALSRLRRHVTEHS